MKCDHKKALDLAKAGKWNESHALVQEYSDDLSCLIHAYLHRVEGDLDNARYWYGQADAVMPDNSLEQELNRLYAMADDA
jgi:hypothetical protein